MFAGNQTQIRVKLVAHGTLGCHLLSDVHPLCAGFCVCKKIFKTTWTRGTSSMEFSSHEQESK